jgi:hypothetical protein
MKYNCHSFALNVHANEIVRSLAENGVFPNAAFVRHLIASRVLQEVQADEAGEGDIVVYFEGGEPRHSGKLVGDGRVASKWGTGNQYVHGLFEIPDSYGDFVRYFRDVDERAVAQSLREYAVQNQGDK